MLRLTSAFLSAQRSPNRSQKRFDLDRLAENLVTTRSQRILGHFSGSERADGEDWCLRELLTLSNLARGFDAIQRRQRQVHQDQIRFYSIRLPQALLAVAGLDDPISFG